MTGLSRGDPIEELLFWSNQVCQYLNLKRLAVGLNQEEQQLLDGLQGAVDRATTHRIEAQVERNTSTEYLSTSPYE